MPCFDVGSRYKTVEVFYFSPPKHQNRKHSCNISSQKDHLFKVEHFYRKWATGGMFFFLFWGGGWVGERCKKWTFLPKRFQVGKMGQL